MSRAGWIRLVAATAFGLCLLVVVLGGYVRSSAAGLGCPDWPGCYGHLTPSAVADKAAAGGPVIETGKAWREMIHRYAAGSLGALIVVIGALAIQWRKDKLLSIPFAAGLLLLVLVQAAFGRLTVTWQLQPLIVTSHLLLGLCTLSLLWWLVMTLWAHGDSAWHGGGALHGHVIRRAQRWALIGLLVLALQLALGGWTSSNYAAIACPDLPTCQNQWWPKADFGNGFQLWRDAVVNFEGGVLSLPARVAIQLTHRLGALVTALALVWTAFCALRIRGSAEVRQTAWALLGFLVLQLLIGSAMVLRGFPLWLATAHNAGAALLLLAAVALNRVLRPT
ncbi:MAG TPA: COX15/CtaA family protein [Steroidobacteraceae bacterium]